MIYLYGLVEKTDMDLRPFLKDLLGVTGDVNAAPVDLGTLIFGPASDTELLPKRRHLLAHTRVLEAFSEAGALLPMRFGMMADSVASVDAMLTARKPDVFAQFEKVRGRVELGLRISIGRDDALAAVLSAHVDLRRERDRLARLRPAPHFESAELGRRLAEALDRRRTDAQKKLTQALAPFADAYVIHAPEEDIQLLNADFLVDGKEQEQFVAQADTLAREYNIAPGSEPTVQVIGPVPAFNFVTLSLNGDSAEAA